jgi:hypothetical protein
MPIAALAPIIAAGVGVGGSLLAGRQSARSALQQQDAANNSPTALAQADLIKHQTDMSKWGFGEAKNLLPAAKSSIDLPFEHFKAILSGNPDEFNKVLAGSNQAIDQQTDSARKNISNFSPRGAQAGQIAQLATGNAQAKQSNYFQAYLNSLTGAQGAASQYGNLFNSLLAGGQGSAAPALNALTSQMGFQTQRDLQSQQLRAQSMTSMGQGIGSILMSLLLNRGGGGSRTPSTPPFNPNNIPQPWEGNF